MVDESQRYATSVVLSTKAEYYFDKYHQIGQNR